jgi:hypothetical protein
MTRTPLTIPDVERSGLDGAPESERLEETWLQRKAKEAVAALSEARRRGLSRSAALLAEIFASRAFVEFSCTDAEEAEELRREIVLAFSGKGNRKTLGRWTADALSLSGLDYGTTPLIVSQGLVAHLRESSTSQITICGQSLGSTYRECKRSLFSFDSAIVCVRCKDGAKGKAAAVASERPGRYWPYGAAAEALHGQLAGTLAAILPSLPKQIGPRDISDLRSRYLKAAFVPLIELGLQKLYEQTAAERFRSLFGGRQAQNPETLAGLRGLGAAIEGSCGPAETLDWPEITPLAEAIARTAAAGGTRIQLLTRLTLTAFPKARDALNDFPGQDGRVFALIAAELERS